MKKTVCIILSLSFMLTVFFCIPVNAAVAANIASRSMDQASFTGPDGNLQLTTYAMQLYPETDTSLEGGTSQATVVNMHFRNNTTSAAYVGDAWFRLQFSATAKIQNWENISTDIFIRTCNTQGAFYIGANNTIGYQEGFVIAPKSSIDMVAIVYTQAVYNTSTGVILNSLNGVETNISTVTFGDFPVGEAADLSLITDYLDSIDENIDQISDIISDLRNLMTWSGSIPTISYPASYYNSYNGTLAENITWGAEISYNGCSISSETVDFEPPDDSYVNREFRHQYTVYFKLYNGTGSDLNADQYFDLNGLQFSGSHSTVVKSFFSDVFTTPYLDTKWGDFYFYIDKSSQILQTSYSRFVLIIEVYTSSSDRPTFSTPTLRYGGTFSVYDNDLNDSSDTIANQSDQIHSQEAAYYQQNSAAIQATGLSNYQFDASAVSGLTGVRGDFIDVWNSLGGWNSVYIFSLTLGLALTILRHSPSAVSSIVRRRNQGGSHK